MWDPSPFYAHLAEVVGSRLSDATGVPRPAAETLAREAGVLVAYLFLDRAMRWQRLIGRTPASGLAASYVAPPDVRADLLKLRVLSGNSREFNQALIAELAPAWGVSVVDRIPATTPPPAKPEAGAKNFNFSAVGLPRRVLRRAARDGGRFFGKVPCLGLAYASDYFLDGWVVGPGLFSPLAFTAPPAPALNPGLRARVLGLAADEARPELEELLGDWGFANGPAVARLFGPYLDRVWPASLLEGAAAGVDSCRKALARYGRRPLVFSDSGDARTSLAIAAAKADGREVIDLQHAVHYGFTSATTYTELEYSHCDRFVTWGWSRLPEHPFHRRVATVPLPTPFLSERRREWRSLLAGYVPGRAHAHDVLLMTDKFQDYPATAGTNRLSRNDFIPDFAVDLGALVGALCGAELSVLHKPFDRPSREALRHSVRELSGRHEGRYCVYEGIDKGLTRELIESCGMIVWDEPGTGWFECLVSGIPTLLYWPRIYNAEEPYAREDFARMEAAGLVHRRPESLAAAVGAFRRDPSAWMGDAARRGKAEEFCRRYAWVEDGWSKRWRAFARELAAGV